MPEPYRRFVADLLKLAAIIVFIVVPIRVYVAQPFIVSGASMAPTFQSGQYLIIDQFSYYFESPERGEVVIFRFPYEPGTFFIKRVIGLPGETVIIEDGTVTIVNDADPEGRTLNEPYIEDEPETSGRLVTELGPNEYFVLGDNRSASSDSRKWGALPREFIVGKTMLRLLPLGEITFQPGTVEKLKQIQSQ